MKILSKGEGMPFDSAIALGMFDGVHLGHSAVIDNVVKSKEEGLRLPYLHSVLVQWFKNMTENCFIYLAIKLSLNFLISLA